MPPPSWTMRRRNSPPTRRSISTESRGVSNPSGPNHFATWSGSVHALNTSSRGASRTRSIVISCSAVCAGVESFICWSFLYLHLFEVLLEPVHAALPHLPVRLDPRGGLSEGLATEPAR